MSNKIHAFDKQITVENSFMPRHPFLCTVVGSRGSGKTTTVLNLITRKEFLKDQFNQCYFFSPTAKLDEKVDILRRTPFLVPNIALHKKLLELKKTALLDFDPNTQFTNPEDQEKVLQDSNIFPELDLDEIVKIRESQKAIIKQFGKKIADKILIVFDDLSAFKKALNSRVFMDLAQNGRHYNVSIFFMSQNYFQIVKSVRNQASQVIMYNTGNSKDLKAMYDDNQNGKTFEEFLDYFNYCTKDEFGFLVCNNQNRRGYKFQNKFEEYLQHED